MIIIDTETTSLLGPAAAPLSQQPRIMEICCIKLTDTKGKLKEVDSFTSLLDPGLPIPIQSSKISGITDDMVKGKPKFTEVFPRLVEFFLGERYMLAHNLPFDRGCFGVEIQRIGRLHQFPWPPVHICTAEETAHMNGGRYMKQEVLYEKLFGKPANQTHRAEGDARQLLEIVLRLRKDGVLN